MQSQIVEKRDYLTISEMFSACLKHWWWFVLSVFVMSSLAYVFMKHTKPLYRRSATMLVLTNGNNEYYKYSDLKIKGLGIGTSKTRLPDAIATLHSVVLMTQVVEKLGLDVEYRLPGTYFNQLVYGKDVPVSVTFFDPSLSGDNFKLEMLKGGNLELSEFSKFQKDSPRVVGHLGDTLSTPLGKILITGKTDYDNLCAAMPNLVVYKYLPKEIASNLVDKLEVENARIWTDVISLTLVDQSIERADTVLNTLMQVYDENAMKNYSKSGEKTLAFLQSRVIDLTNRLNGIDDNIASYKGANLISEVESNQSMYFKDKSEHSLVVNRHRAQLAALNYVKDNLRQNMGSNRYIPTDIIVENNYISALIGNYNDLQTKRNDLASSTGVGNPAVVDLDRQLSIYRNTILSTIEQTVSTMETQMIGLQQTSRSINRNMARSAHHEMYMISTSRMRRVLEKLYEYLFMQKEKSQIALTHNVSTIQVYQKAYGSAFPIAPLKKQIMMIGIVLGIAIPFIIVFFKTINDDKVYLSSDLVDLQIPLIGELPSMKGMKPIKDSSYKRVPIFVEENARDIFNECMRLLRTNLEFMRKDKASKLVIMMTSAEPECGKSFVSSNLAASMALVGKKVALVDLDMRKASVSKLARNVKKGVSNYLSYRSDNIDGLMCKDAYFKGVDLLPVGSIPPNPSELLHTKRMADLIEWLKTNYDCIIIDCPPIDIVTDGDLINVYADITIFVLRAGKTNLSMLSDANYIYSEKRFSNMCAVLNDVKQIKGGNNHYYGASRS